MDWFTPDNQSYLSDNDIDLGSGNPVLLPDQTAGPVAHLLVAIGKQGIVYLINRDDMGNFQPGSNQVVQSFTGSPSGFYGTPAFWQNNLYFAGSLDNTGSGDYLKLFSFNPSTGQFDTAPASQSAHYFNFPGASPSVSSQGASNGIVWAIDASAYGYANPNADGTELLSGACAAVVRRAGSPVCLRRWQSVDRILGQCDGSQQSRPGGQRCEVRSADCRQRQGVRQHAH